MPKQAIIVLIIGIALLAIASLFIFGITNTMQPAKQPEPTKETTMNTKNIKKLKIEDLEIGKGKEVKKGDTIVIHYQGLLPDGAVFDSSYDRRQPFETQIGTGQVIKGWDIGVIGMKVGGIRKLTIPPDLAYGNQAVGSIPANSTLIFELELIDVK